jgi:hypothetical protein
MEEEKGVYRILVGRPEGKRPPRRPRHRWDSNIKLDLREIRMMGQTRFSWLRIGSSGRILWNTLMILRVP